MKDAFGDRMKFLEGLEAGRVFVPTLPVLARLDGKGFSNYTRKMERPYDKRLSDLMIATTTFLIAETNACMGYTQSDEISLAWYSPNYETQVYFNGKIQKICSVLASMTTAFFNANISKFFEEPLGMAMFDCRVWSVPTLEERANTFLWREKDATKNSISMATREYFSHKELYLKSGKEMQEMLWQKHNINWNDYPDFFKRGSFIQRKKRLRRFTIDEMDKLPEKHLARKIPDLLIERTDYVRLDMPSFVKVANRAGVIFFGEDPNI